MRLHTLYEARSPRYPPHKRLMRDCASAARSAGFDIRDLPNGAKILTRGSGKGLTILSGVHGNERSGPLFLCYLLKKFASGEKKIPSTRMTIIPCINDYGWDKNDRRWFSRNLNQEFSPTAPKHIRLLMNHLRKHPPAVFADFHEDYEARKPYIYGFRDDTTGLHEELSEHLDAPIEKWHKWDKSSECYVRQLGTTKAVTIELPTEWSMEDRFEAWEKAFDFLIKKV